MPEDKDGLEKLYAEVIESVREDGFLGVTTADVAEVHDKLKAGSSANGLVGRAIARHLRDYINAEHTKKTL